MPATDWVWSVTVWDVAPFNTMPLVMFGPARVGAVLRTTLPDPVEVVTPVPPFRTATVPVTLAALPEMFPVMLAPLIVVDAVTAPVPLPYR